MKKPETLTVMGVPFKITYCDKMTDCDVARRQPFAGSSDLLTQEIKVYDKDCRIEFVWQTIFHELLHMIGDMTRIGILNVEDDKQKHNELDCLANVLLDTLVRNDLIKLED